MSPRMCATDGCRKPARQQRTTCNGCRQRFRRHGDPAFSTWTVADPFDVQLIVERGRPAPGLTRLEQRLVARELNRRGATAADIARIVCTSERNVHRWRADDRNGRIPVHSHGHMAPARVAA